MKIKFLFSALAACALALAPNISAADEAGFVRLFDGKTLEGWKLVGKRGPGYLIEEGAIVCPPNGGGNLFTEKEFSDFAMRFEFQLRTNSNNGVGIRAPLEGDAAYVGMEIQILDDTGPAWAGKLRPAQYHGSLYDVVAAKQGALKPAGEWNEQEILAQGRHVKVTLNGKVILDADLNSVTDPAVLARHPGLLRERGHIGFLGHDAYAAFRNIRVKNLSSTPKANTPPPGFTALFNGKDLDGWQGLVELPKLRKMTAEEAAAERKKANDLVPKNWVVENGSITHIGKAFHNLCTVKEYGDFELWVDWMTPRNSDSGIYLRGSPQVQIWADPIGSGGLFNNEKGASKPTVRADKPIGQWNNFKILMQGANVTVFLNDALVAHNVPLENYWDRKAPIFNEGPIELQAHEDPISFRNIYIRALPRK